MQSVRPEEVGLSSARLSRIDPVMQRRVDQGELAGVITVVARKGKIAHLKCFGMMDIESRKPMQPDAILRFYSMSKPITSAALLTLYEEGCFQLDDPVSAFIPELKELKVLRRMTPAGPELEYPVRPVTIRHLFTHTSGICYPNPEGSPAEKLLAEAMGPHEGGDEGGSLADWIPLLAKAPLAHQPGEAWTYGFSIDVLGRLAEVISGKPFDEFLQERLFGPLGMVDTGFYAPPDKAERLAKVYGLRKEGGLELVEWSTNAFSRKPKFFSGGGGLVSTAMDYLRFAQMLLNGGALDGVRVLGRKIVALMASNHVPQLALPCIQEGWAFRLGYTMGLGMRVVVDEAASGLSGSVGSFTWAGLAATDFWVDPREELIGLFLPQAIPGPAGMHEQYRVLVYQALE
jgi:CubicO group peptidase (beta-lactamase class C family)